MGIFTRDEEELLSYDADAFFYFAATVIFVVLVPWTVTFVKGLVNPTLSEKEDYDGSRNAPAGAKVRMCKVAVMETRRQAAEKERATLNCRFGPYGKMHLAVLLLAWCVQVGLFMRLQDTPAELVSFDPYAILGISADAEPKAIKKAYRQMSLKHHPDKDPENPLAHVKFQQISKAYAALTDDAARENFQKYGNTDGPGQTKVGVAMHPGMVGSKENQLATLLILFVLIVVTPTVLIWNCLKDAHLNPGDVSGETVRIFSSCLGMDFVAERCPALLAASAEARRMPPVDMETLIEKLKEIAPNSVGQGVEVQVRDDAEQLGGLAGIVTEYSEGAETCTVLLTKEDSETSEEIRVDDLLTINPKLPLCFSDYCIQDGAMLVWSHMMRLHHLMTPRTRANLDDLLHRSMLLGRAMTSIAGARTGFFGQGGGERSGYFQLAVDTIHFRQRLVQALTFTDSPLKQLPHVTDVPGDAPSFEEVLEGGPVVDKFLDKLGLDDQQKLDVHAFRNHVSRVSLSCHIEIVDEDALVEGDVATMTITLTRNNLQEGEAVGPVHAPYMPCPKHEEWWLIVNDERARRLTNVVGIRSTGHKVEREIRFQLPRGGDYNWKIHAMCDSYVGLDITHDFSFKVVDRKDVDRKIFIHPEDMKIKTLIEEIMEGLEQKENESDSDDDNEAPAGSPKKASPTKSPTRAPLVKKKNKKKADSDSGSDSESDSDSDAEEKPEAEKAEASATGTEETTAGGSEEREKVEEGEKEKDDDGGNGGDDDDDDSSDDGGDDKDTDFSFYKIVGSAGAGAPVFMEPGNPATCVGGVGPGTIVRGAPGAKGPPGWILLRPGGGWIKMGAQPEAKEKGPVEAVGESTVAEEEGNPEQGIEGSGGDGVKEAEEPKPKCELICIGGLEDVTLRTLLELTPIPFGALRKWLHDVTKREVEVADMLEVLSLHDGNFRTALEEGLRKRLGDEKFLSLRDQADVLYAKRAERMSGLLGYWSNAEGQAWRVTSNGNAFGAIGRGRRVRDKIVFDEEDKVFKLGPLCLDPAKSNFHTLRWVRGDGPNERGETVEYVIHRDESLDTRTYVGALESDE